MLADDGITPTYAKWFYSLNVDEQEPTPVKRSDLDLSILPAARGLKLGVTDSGAVYVIVFDIPKWGGYAGAKLGLPPMNNQSHVLGDENGDGVYEISFQDSAAAVSAFGDTVTCRESHDRIAQRHVVGRAAVDDRVLVVRRRARRDAGWPLGSPREA